VISETTTGGALIGAARDHPDATALVFPGHRQTYRELGRAADGWARRLVALGVRPGEHVGLLMTNCPAFVELVFAIGQVGAVAVPINPRYRAGELAYVLVQSDVAPDARTPTPTHPPSRPRLTHPHTTTRAGKRIPAPRVVVSVRESVSVRVRSQ
jgi:acyl-CoA synthetase (AMP-forming)/AMP-acid ligase II